MASAEVVSRGRWLIEFYAAGNAYASDCDADWYCSFEAAEAAAPAAMADVDWAVRWSVRFVAADDGDDGDAATEVDLQILHALRGMADCLANAECGVSSTLPETWRYYADVWQSMAISLASR